MFGGAVESQWIRPRFLNREVPGSNLMAMMAGAVVPLGKALYPHCLVAQKGLKGPMKCKLSDLSQ